MKTFPLGSPDAMAKEPTLDPPSEEKPDCPRSPDGKHHFVTTKGRYGEFEYCSFCKAVDLLSSCDNQPVPKE